VRAGLRDDGADLPDVRVQLPADSVGRDALSAVGLVAASAREPGLRSSDSIRPSRIVTTRGI
jgi:hypothetical protein